MIRLHRAAQWLVVFGLPTAFGSSQRADGAPSGRSSTAQGPMVFHHRVHADEFQIPCRFCHSYADQARVAGIPSLRKCMGCHKFGPKDNAAVQQLAAMFAAGKSPTFARVDDLPDYVYFSHRVHVLKDVTCEECHGGVAKMETVVPAHAFTMGFCLDCHRRKGASVDCIGCHK